MPETAHEFPDDPLDTPAQFVPRVGPRKAELLAKVGVHTARDLLFFLPRDVLDLTRVARPEDLTADAVHTVRGVVVDKDARNTRTGKILTGVLLDCGGGQHVRGTWFNQPWMIKKFEPGQPVLFSGKPKRHQGRWEFGHPRVQWLFEEGEDGEDGTGDGDQHGAGVQPRYPLTEGLTHAAVNDAARAAVEKFAADVCDPLPAAFRTEHGLPHLRDAAGNLHAAKEFADFAAARRRLLFDDLFEFQLGVALRRRVWRRGGAAPPLPVSAKIDARIRRLFPFEFTRGQNEAVRDVARDLAGTTAMHRLLQADVGAGKTVVAVYAMLAAVAHGRQAVLMAPTEVLANQHWETIHAALAHSRVERRLLTGRLTTAKRNRLREKIARGDVDLVVGTQAVIQEGVSFPNLGVAVVDEQHKFGVAQRASFSAGAGRTAEGVNPSAPHVLVMTATPIPRSLSLTQFGDLDVTSVRDLPPGRQKVVTSRVPSAAARKRAWAFLRGKLEEGRQLFVICPKVTDTDGEATLDFDDDADPGVSASVEATFAALTAGELKGFDVGLVHGQLPPDEKAKAMEDFRTGETRALVSTTVVEVGVDVPNATLMVIHRAEQFGLSQLHQLRGRVARGSRQGHCLLFTDSSGRGGAKAEASKRLAVLEQTGDGFRIAEADFELRGPGDVLGLRQSGQTALRRADLRRDAELLDEARRLAFHLVETGRFDAPEWAMVKADVLDRFGETMELPKTG